VFGDKQICFDFAREILDVVVKLIRICEHCHGMERGLLQISDRSLRWAAAPAGIAIFRLTKGLVEKTLD
jgi:hypothetical protein